MRTRRVEAKVIYAGKNISDRIQGYLESVSYSDVASGTSDTLSITLDNADGRWMDSWMPEKGERMKARIVGVDWEREGKNVDLDCGEFEIDSLRFNGSPAKCEMRAIGIPQSEEFHSRKRTKTWEGVTLRQIAEEIASRAGVSLYYEGSSIRIQSVEQNSQEDSKFLYSLCQNYGMAMKVYAWKIIIFEEEIFENKAAVAEIKKEDVYPGWSYSTDVAGTYTGATMSFSDPDNDKDYIIHIGWGSRILEINVTADSLEDAERKGIAKLNEANKKATTMSITLPFRPVITAGTCIQLAGFGRLSGKYYVDKVVTGVSGSGATTTALTLRLVLPRIKTVSIQTISDVQQEQKEQEGTPYTVMRGDTLWDLAVTFLGNGLRYVEIYNNNRDVIESTAKGRGKRDSGNGHWIFPGTVLMIPPK